jgi:plasmid stabilization system protein ParE
LLQRAEGDFSVAERALEAIADGIVVLELAPLSCRKATAADPFLRELVIGFGASGYVLLFEVEDGQTVTVLAVRHQREDDYH